MRESHEERANSRMTNKCILVGVLLALSVVCIVLLIYCIKYKVNLSREQNLRLHTEWVMYDCIRNIGGNISLDSIAKGKHLILRYDSKSCLTCIAKAEELLEDVFGMEYLESELCCIGSSGQVKPFKGITYIQNNENISPMDEVYTPYFCIINDNGVILYSLSLIPDMYDYNHKLLTKLKRSIKCPQKGIK